MKSFLLLSITFCFLCTGSAQHNWSMVNASTPTYPDYTPVIKLHSPTSKLYYGDAVHFSCEVMNTTTVDHYKFWKDGNMLSIIYAPDYRMSYLLLSDSGDYWCSATINGEELRSRNAITIDVILDNQTNNTSGGVMARTTPYPVGTPYLILNNPMPFYYEGAGAHFTCKSNGYGNDVSYGLKKDGQFITQQRSSDFYLYNMKVSDSGRYTCSVLLVYRLVDSDNSVYVQVVGAQPGWGDGDGGNYNSGVSTFSMSHAVLIISVAMMVKNTLMKLQA